MNGRGESNSIAVSIEDSVKFLHEDISKDPQGAMGEGDIEGHHKCAAFFIAEDLSLDHVLMGVKGVLISAEDEGEFAGHLVVSAVIFDRDVFEEFSQVTAGASDKGGSSVDDSLAAVFVAKAEGFTVVLDVVHLDGPVVLVDDFVVVQLALESVSVDVAEGNLAIDAFIERVVEGHDVVLEEPVFDDGVEDGGEAVSRHVGVGEAEDAREFTGSEDIAGLIQNFSEFLTGDDQLTESELVFVDFALHCARSESNLHA